MIFSLIASLQTSKKFFLRIALASLLWILFLLHFEYKDRFSAAVIWRSVAMEVFLLAKLEKEKMFEFYSEYRRFDLMKKLLVENKLFTLPILNWTKFGLNELSFDISLRIKSPPFAQNRRQYFKLWKNIVKL